MNNISFANLLKEYIGNEFYVAIYSKAKTKKDLERIVKENPQDPPVDMSESPGGPAGTPNEIKDHYGIKLIRVTGTKTRYTAILTFKNNKWTVK